MGIKTSHVAFDKTATHDNPFRLVDTPMPYYEVTIFILTNDATMGDGTIMAVPLAANGIYNDKVGDLHDIFFKNTTPASNTRIVAFATIPVAHVQDALRVGGVII